MARQCAEVKLLRAEEQALQLFVSSRLSLDSTRDCHHHLRRDPVSRDGGVGLDLSRALRVVGVVVGMGVVVDVLELPCDVEDDVQGKLGR